MKLSIANVLHLFMHHKKQRAENIDNVLKLPIYKSIYHRLPWLIVGLIGGIIASKIVKNSEAVLSENLILATFIPLIVYISDAVGTQMETFVIRDMALHRVKFLNYFIRQLIVVTLISTILALTLFLYLVINNNKLSIALVLGLSLFCAIISSLFSGLIVPYLFRKIRLDPANASGPIATIIQDLVSVTIYFSIANSLL